VSKYCLRIKYRLAQAITETHVGPVLHQIIIHFHKIPFCCYSFMCQHLSYKNMITRRTTHKCKRQRLVILSFCVLTDSLVDYRSRTVYGTNFFIRSWVRIPFEVWIPVRLFCVCVVLRAGSGIATGWSPVQEVLQTVYRLSNRRSFQGPTKGCRTIDRYRFFKGPFSLVVADRIIRR
jgi:hypothetical protein